MEGLPTNITPSSYGDFGSLAPEGAAFIQMWGAELPQNSNMPAPDVTPKGQNPLEKMATVFAAEHLGQIADTGAGGHGEATLEAVEVRGAPLSELKAVAEAARGPKTIQPRSFAPEGKNDPESLKKLNRESFGRREVDLGRYMCTGQLAVVVDGKFCNSTDNPVERMRQTLGTFAQIVKLDEATEKTLLHVDMMQRDGKINPEQTQAHFDRNENALAPYTDKAGPLHNAVSQGVMIALGTDALKECSEKVGVLEGGDRVTVMVKGNNITVQHDIQMHGKVFNEQQHKEVADPNGPKQFIGRYSMEGKIDPKGNITWKTAIKSLHILPNAGLKRDDFIAIQDKLSKAGLLNTNQKDFLENVKKNAPEYYELFSKPTVNPLYGGGQNIPLK